MKARVSKKRTSFPNRGRALCELSEELPQEFLDGLRNLPAPKGSERWSHVGWFEFFCQPIRAWLDAANPVRNGVKQSREDAGG